MTVLAVFALITAGYLAFCFARARPGDFAPAPGDLVVCAAHSDDCAIMAGEMAAPLLAAGPVLEASAEAKTCWKLAH